MLLLGPRYANDKIVFRNLTGFQRDMIKSIESKIESGQYLFEKIPCAICGGSSFDCISDKDRYGLYLPVVVCRQCGLVQTNPRMNQESYNQFYNSEYRRLYHATEQPTEEWFTGQQYTGSWIFKYLEESGVLKGRNPSETLVLEVGCGSGGILQYFKEKGFQVKGIDLGDEYLQHGKVKFGLDLETTTLENLKMERKADLVIYCHVFEHILDPNKELQILKRFIHENTLLYFEVPGVKNLLNDYRNDWINYLQNAHVYHYTLTSLQNIMKKNGFEFICGTETVKSVFKPGKGGASFTIVNDHKPVIAFLHKAEFIRKYVPFVPHEVKERVAGSMIRFLKSAGLFFAFRTVYRSTFKKLRQAR